MNQTWKNDKKNFGGDVPLVRLAQMWAHKSCFVSFTSTTSKKLFEAIILCNFQEN